VSTRTSGRIRRLERVTEPTCSLCGGQAVSFAYDDGGGQPLAEPLPCPECGALPSTKIIFAYSDVVQTDTDA
jgi:hypothetical protein